MDRPGVTHSVVEVGPVTVRAERDAAADLAATALDCVDDDLALLDEQPVAVVAVWGQVFREIWPEPIETAVLVCPTWWPSPRIERVRAAAAARCSKVVVKQRSELLGGEADGMPTVVEIAPEFVVISRAGRVVAAEPRFGEHADTARSLTRRLDSAAAVVVDAPTGVDGAVDLARTISECLRRSGVDVRTAHRDQVVALARARQASRATERTPIAARGLRAVAAAAVTVSAALVFAGLALPVATLQSDATSVPMTLLVEGRVALKVPALWGVQRITSGPGSARVQATAPDGATAILLTQARVRSDETLSAVSASLRSALAEQQSGIFSRFNPDDRRADRPVATYREVRDGRQIQWVVFVDDGVRIGVGCQSAPGGEHIVDEVCDEAIRSAHVLT
ncbi:type VII secretion-associated protein [Mycolicibacterium moriokaense]|nr:type VII secretion-associated protein [Mycolicibacterium moriokaense]